MSGKEKSPDDLTAPIKRRGNQPFVPTDKERQQVERMVGLGLTQEQIAKILNIAESTLKKYFREELDNGEAKANSAVAQNLFGIATSRGPLPPRSSG